MSMAAAVGRWNHVVSCDILFKSGQFAIGVKLAAMLLVVSRLNNTSFNLESGKPKYKVHKP
jgi:hypothetical protein